MMLEIVRIHNELLGTYGDRGNADVIKYRAGLAGIDSRSGSVTDEGRYLSIRRCRRCCSTVVAERSQERSGIKSRRR